MKITLLVIGKTKESWCGQGEQYYIKRLQPFCDFEKIEIVEEKITPSVSDEDVKNKEGKKIFARVPKGYFVVALSPEGKEFSSESFAQFLGEIKNHKGGKICFLIGSPLGLSGEVLNKADAVMSFSRMTFPHDLFRIICLEQLYRAFSILSGKKYHK